MAAAKKLNSSTASEKVLKQNGGGPMPVKDVVAGALKLVKLNTKTPEATVAHAIYMDAKHGKRFRIVERGVVELLGDLDPAKAIERQQEQESPHADDSPAVTPGSVVVRNGADAKPDPKAGKKAGRKAKDAAPAAESTEAVTDGSTATATV